MLTKRPLLRMIKLISALPESVIINIRTVYTIPLMVILIQLIT